MIARPVIAVAWLLALAILVGSLFVGQPPVALAALLPLGYALAVQRRAHARLDTRIAAVVGQTSEWSVNMKVFPSYKFVDVHRAAASFAKRSPSTELIASEYMFLLQSLLGGVGRGDVTIAPATQMARKISYTDQVFLPADAFWLMRTSGELPSCVVRARFVRNSRQVTLEVAARQEAKAIEIIEAIVAIASQESIYRNKSVRISVTPEAPEHYGDEDRDDPVDLIFTQDTPVGADDIVLEEATRELLDRTVVDFHRRRGELMALGLPGRRGVLFYGPPGTGKTYTCRYLSHRVEPVTTVIATGHALLNMKAICGLARSLQPALVLLEDVDLVFMDRQMNSYATVLGEFLDQLDGFAPDDEVIFILTTNALERVEGAIKDRPGRVSQVVYFGPPSAPLRRRYLETQLRHYDLAQVELEQIVNRTDGVSQAFLKELVFRAVQFATMNNSAGITLHTEHIISALDDMIGGGGKSGRRIIGFQVEHT